MDKTPNTHQRFDSRFKNFLWELLPDWQQEHMVAIGEWSKLLERDSKYEKITYALLFASYFNPVARFFPGRPVGVAPSLFPSYFFCRIVDDIADGDTPLPPEFGSFEELIAQLKGQIQDGNPESQANLGLLLRGTVRDTLKYGGQDPSRLLIQFLDAMKLEHDRRVKQAVSTKNELYTLYQNSFAPPQDIALIGVHSSVRSADIPQLADIQGRLYGVRDLHNELSRGIFFIPSEILQESGLDKNDIIKYPEVIDNNPVIQTWIADELEEGKQMIEQLRKEKLDWQAKKIVGFLTTGIETFIKSRQVLKQAI